MLFHKTLGYYGHIIDMADEDTVIGVSHVTLSNGEETYKLWHESSHFFVACPD